VGSSLVEANGNREMSIKRLGFYREFFRGRSDYPSIRASLWGQDEDGYGADRARLADYLRDATVVVPTAGLAELDVIDPSKGLAGTTDAKSDGEWVWPALLSHYVRHYPVQLAEDFIKDVRSRGWQVEALTPEERSAVSAELRLADEVRRGERGTPSTGEGAAR
jgi:hypothetical protein